MSRTYLPAIVSSALSIGVGISVVLLWGLATGRAEMPPWWLTVLLAGGAAWIADLAEQGLRAVRRRRLQASRRAHARTRPTTRRTS